MQTPSGTAPRGGRAVSPLASFGSAFKERAVDNANLSGRLEKEAEHWGRLLTLMEGRRGCDSTRSGTKEAAKARGVPEPSQTPGEALVQRLTDLSGSGINFSKGSGRRSVKRAVCEVLAAVAGRDQKEVLAELHLAVKAVLKGQRDLKLRGALDFAKEHLDALGVRDMMPAGCSTNRAHVLSQVRSERSYGEGRRLGLGLLTHAACCAMEGRGEELRTALKALAGLFDENRMPTESLGMLSIQLLVQCQVVSLASGNELSPAIVRSVASLLKQFREPLLSRVESDIGAMPLVDADGLREEPSTEAALTVPWFERLPWLLRSAPNGLREGASHLIALLIAGWAMKCAYDAFDSAVDGQAWPQATILGLTVGLAFIGFDRLFQKCIVDRQAFRLHTDPQLGRYAESKCFNLMRWTSLILPWVLPISFFMFGLASFDSEAISQGHPELNDSAAFEPESLHAGSSNASECEIAAAMAMSAERIEHAWRCALIPVQAQLTGLVARPLRDLLQSATRSRWTSGLSLCRRIINAQGREEFIKLTDDEQWRVWLLRDVLYAVSSVATLGVGQVWGKDLISLIQLRTCLVHEAIGIEFKSVYGPMNETFDGFWPDLACRLVAWCPALVGLESPSDSPLVCTVDRQPCVLEDGGLQKFQRHFVRNASARIATAAAGNDAFGSLATLCSRLGHPRLEGFFLVVGSLFNAATGGARARSANYLANPDDCAHPDTVTRLAEVIATGTSSASLTPLTPREREIRENMERRHAIVNTFKSGGDDDGDGTGIGFTQTSAIDEDSWRQGDHADESSQ